MDIIECIQQEAKINKWPYPKTFEVLKAAGITSYTVKIGEHYQALYVGSMGNIVHSECKNYMPLTISKEFSSHAIKKALVIHANGKTNYVEFLADIANAGVSHYKVNMATREIRYFNLDETHYHQEIVPLGYLMSNVERI